MNRLKPIQSADDIPGKYRNTPIGLLLEYHNLERPLDSYTNACLLVGMCMDYRKNLRMPDNFSFFLRVGGANLRYSEFKVSYAIAVGEVKHIALIGHTQCGMVNLAARKDLFIAGMVERAGWTADQAQEYFMQFAPMFEIGNEVDFVLGEAQRLRLRYPKITVAPLIFKVEDNRLYLIAEPS